ncbi:MAG: hypothetical protein PHP46_00850 [Candidatus Omnitrophica bacterium]|nr:hypothetical protein [Candidatus Omnitrophota bacterium]
MIKLDITTAIFIYVLFSVIITLLIWIIYGYKGIRTVAAKDIEFIWKCPVCYNTYIDSKHEDISVCPLCGSYNKKEENQKGVGR